MYDMKVGTITFGQNVVMKPLWEVRVEALEARIKELEDKLELKQQTIDILRGAIK